MPAYPTSLDRRSLLKGGASLGALALLPIGARAQVAAEARPDPRVAALFDTFFQENLRRSPELATYMNLDKGALAELKSKLTIDTDAERARDMALTRTQQARLQALEATSLSPADQLNVDVIAYTLKNRAAIEAFDFGGSAFSPSPYVVSQLTGSYQDTPDFLDTKHSIETAADADAYLSRLGQFAEQLDADTARLRHDSGMGIVPPDFLLDKTIDQMAKTRVPAGDATVVTSIARRAKVKGLSDRYGTQAAQIYDAKVLPALDRQLALVRALRKTARHDAGVWQFKQGPAFYQAALQSTTTTRLSPEEIHKFGLDQAAELSARLDTLLKAQGMTKGTIGQRMAALYKDPAQLYPNTDAGKAQAIAYCNDRLARIRTKLPTVFDRLPSYKFEVRRVPAALEAGAASAYSQPPAIDGSRPGLVYFNLADTAEWPKFCLATTVFHEGLPGHQLEGGLALSNKNLPILRKLIGFSGYAEGWALYAEQLADEIGMYDDDPYGRLGYLKFQLFRANRCVVDTGIHHYQWSRERAIQHFVDAEGEAPGFATREVERYCATPGQACSYKLGHSVFIGLRAKAKQALGDRFQIKRFHDAVLDCGRVPLDILQQVGDRWIATQTA